jgi:MFS family permease
MHCTTLPMIFILLPVWQREFGLGYAEVGMLRGLYAGAMATFQIPAAMLAERMGAAAVLALGTALAGLGYGLAGFSTGFAMLVLALMVGGLGASAQHPLGAALIARAFAGPRSLKALGTYNFAGDIGKMTVPAAGALLLTVMAWQPTVMLLGAFGLVCAVAIFLLSAALRRRPARRRPTMLSDIGRSAR